MNNVISLCENLLQDSISRVLNSKSFSRTLISAIVNRKQKSRKSRLQSADGDKKNICGLKKGPKNEEVILSQVFTNN